MKYLTVPIIREIAMFLLMIGCMTLGWGISVKDWTLVVCFGFLFPMMYDWIASIVHHSIMQQEGMSLEEMEQKQDDYLRKHIEKILDESLNIPRSARSENPRRSGRT